MNIHRITTRYSLVLTRIALAMIALLLGHDVVMAAHPHGVGAYDKAHSHHTLMVEECTLADGTAPYAGPVPTPHFALVHDVGVIFYIEQNTGAMLASAAPGLDAERLRLFLQVFLN